jgi:hypothetical protein
MVLRRRLQQLGLGSLLDSGYQDVVYRETQVNSCRRFLHANSLIRKWSGPDCAPRRRGGYQPFEISVARAGGGVKCGKLRVVARLAKTANHQGHEGTRKKLLRPRAFVILVSSVVKGLYGRIIKLSQRQAKGSELPPEFHWNPRFPFRSHPPQWPCSNRFGPPEPMRPHTQQPHPTPN